MSDETITLTPIKLEPGSVYVIEYPRVLSKQQLDTMRATLSEEGDRLGIKFLVLEGGLRLARKAEADEQEPQWA